MTEPGNGERREREEKAERLAYSRGKDAAEIASHLAAHDRHLAAVNGSIDRNSDGLEKLKLEVSAMRVKIAFGAAIGAIVGSGAMSLIVLKAGG